MTFGTMYPMSVYSGKVLLQVMVVFQYACLKLAMFFYQIIKINVFFCQIMKFLATGGSCWRWSQTITSEICVVKTRWNYIGVQNRYKWVFIYLYIRQEHKWETSLIIFQVKTILVIISLDTYFPLINVFWLLYNPVMIVFLFPVLELVRLLNFKLKKQEITPYWNNRNTCRQHLTRKMVSQDRWIYRQCFSLCLFHISFLKRMGCISLSRSNNNNKILVY